MELREAIGKVYQILDEERSNPTVRYSLRLESLAADSGLGQTLAIVTALAAPQDLARIRSMRPREIEEDPRKWKFESVNYNLLCALVSRVGEADRPGFLTAVADCLESSSGHAKCNRGIQPNWMGYVSEFPLIAEFCVRNGAKAKFLETLGELKPSMGLAVLLTHLEDMIALNFTVFTEVDYEVLKNAVQDLRLTAQGDYKLNRAAIQRSPESGLWAEIIQAASAIFEDSRKALYIYLKGFLLEGMNLEIIDPALKECYAAA
jgi:hypothetical protein